MRNKISSWVRQARHRAKRHGCHNELRLDAVLDLVAAYKQRCAYCGQPASVMDHAFPLADKAPNVLANCLPSCKTCKTKKKVMDLIAFQQAGNMGKEEMMQLLRDMLERDGGTTLRDHIKSITGIGS